MNATTEGGGIRPDGGAAEELLARSRVDAAAQRRRRDRWRAERQIEETTLAGTLLGSLSDSVPGPVTLHLDAGNTVTGTVTTVGHDVVELVGPSRSWSIRLESIAAVESDGPLAGDPSDRSSVTLAELLDERVHDGSEVVVTLRTAAVLRGELVGVGDALVLRCASPARHVVVPLDGVATVSGARR